MSEKLMLKHGITNTVEGRRKLRTSISLYKSTKKVGHQKNIDELEKIKSYLKSKKK